jgi:hypothetical protein
VHVEPIVTSLRAALTSQAALAGGDPAVESAVAALAEALEPSLHLAAMDLAQQAAAEVAAQLPDRSVEVVIADGDPALRVTEASEDVADAPAEDFDARITLRLPPSLKRLIEDAATVDGDSVNTWVVDALSKRASKPTKRDRRVTESFDL